MREILEDVRKLIQNGDYKNEEHIRLSLVCRILSKIGWDIWNPREVNTEFPPIPSEDKTKVDIALFAQEVSPSVFIEVKALGKINENNLVEIERQVRDYNRNNTALFSVITDGKLWRLYYSQTGGEFHHKCFKDFDLLQDDLEDIEQTFYLFFGKKNIINGFAQEKANQYLQLNKRQKIVQEVLPQAKKMIQEPPYPTLIQSIKILAKQKGVDLGEKEIKEILGNPPLPPDGPPPPPPPGVGQIDPNNPGDLRFTRVDGTIGEKSARTWKDLVDIGIKLLMQNGYDINRINALFPVNLKEGIYTSEGYSQVGELNISSQGMDANNSAKTLVLIAQKLNCRLKLIVLWYGKSPRAGKQGIIELPN